jgi:hypothetical protein
MFVLCHRLPPYSREKDLPRISSFRYVDLMPERSVEKPPFSRARKNSTQRQGGGWIGPQNRFRGESCTIALQQLTINQTIKNPLIH